MSPKTIDLETQRHLVANAAIKVISETGLEGCKLRDVAREAGITTGAVTHYFDNKEAVLEAALAEAVNRTLARINARQLDQTLEADELAKQLARHLPTHSDSLQEWKVWLAFWGHALTNERFRKIHEEYYRLFADSLIDSLRLLKGISPTQSRQSLKICADALIASLDGVGTRAVLEPEKWSATRQRKTLKQAALPLLQNLTQ